MEVRERILGRIRNVIGIWGEGDVTGGKIGVIGGRKRYRGSGGVSCGGDGIERRRIGGGVLIVLVVIGWLGGVGLSLHLL